MCPPGSGDPALWRTAWGSHTCHRRQLLAVLGLRRGCRSEGWRCGAWAVPDWCLAGSGPLVWGGCHPPCAAAGRASLGSCARWAPSPAASFHRVFGFVARKQGSATDNVCHLFAEHDPEQPASAIVNFVSKVMIGSPKKI